MTNKLNQYRSALIAVESAFQRRNEAVVGSDPGSKASSLGSKVGGSSWVSPKAEEYAEVVRGIVTRMTEDWGIAYDATKAKTDPERDKLMVDEDSDEGWKAHFLEMR